MRQIKENRLLKQYGEKLGREGIALKAIEICKEIAASENYKDAIKALGRFHALSTACTFDGYWTEKRDLGRSDEIYNALKLLEISSQDFY